MTIMHASRSLESMRPLRNAERVHRFRSVPPTDDCERMARDAQIAAGIRWQESFRTRPIPKHRAMIVYEPGQSQAAPLGSPLGGNEPSSGALSADATTEREYEIARDYAEGEHEPDELPQSYDEIRGK